MSFGFCITEALINTQLVLQEKLKAHTNKWHNELEQLMFVDRIMQKQLTLQQYKELLACNYLVHLHNEDALFNNLSAATADALAINRRKKLNSLTLDLNDVGLNKQLLNEQNIDRIAIENECFALGALYVLEGATLGGSVIVKQLRLNQNFSPSLNFNYYNVYGKNLIVNWQNFLAHINAVPTENHDDVLAGAASMFKAIIKIAKGLKEKKFD